MSTAAGSFSAPHFAGNDLPGALDRARRFLAKDGDLRHLNQNQRLAWHLLNDAYRLAKAIPHIIEAAKADSEISAESVEVIVRKILEHAIFLEFLQESNQDESLVATFLANCEAALDRANKRFREGSEKPPPWPNYEQMAESQPALHDLYRRLSYLAHPKTSYPYTLVERGSGMSPSDFFSARADHSVTDVAQILHVAVDNAWAIGLGATGTRRVR